MTFKFDSSQQFQLDAIKAVTDLFIGQPTGSSTKTASINLHAAGSIPGLSNEADVYGNKLLIDDEVLLENLRTIQANNGLPSLADELTEKYFSIEMETGTGKTYVYLRTMMELYLQYGFSKFVLVVPSVAIREGVKAAAAMIKPHFHEVYDGNTINITEYNSKNLSDVRSYATTNQLELLILNIDAINKQSNIFQDDNRDDMYGKSAKSLVQECHPIVIIDEPQKLSSEKARAAIGELNPLCEIAYSATHRNPLNLVYRLDPVQAHEQGLVKTIVVSEVAGRDNANRIHIRLVKTESKGGQFSAKLEILQYNSAKNETTTKIVNARLNSDLYQLSNEVEVYKGWNVSEINAGEELVRFSNGEVVTPTDAKDESKLEIIRTQIRTSIKEYGEKMKKLTPMGIKPLALFFIDHVPNYRVYLDGGTHELGLYGEIFEDEIKKYLGDRKPEDVFGSSISEIHDGYFAKDKTGAWKDSKETKGTGTGAKTADDVSAYDLIMKEKEKLIQFSTPLRFIFSHSALQEGWDNPNVFVICTLRESASEIDRRQTIGRGLRLPVNQEGVRVRDVEHRLSVIANESYQEFSKKLQAEYKAVGFTFGVVAPTTFARIAAPEEIARTTGEDKIGANLSQKIFNHLVDSKIIDSEGNITELFAPSDDNFELPVPPECVGIREAIVMQIQNLQPENLIKIARKPTRIRGNKEVVSEDNEYFFALWEKIKHKTRYRVNFTTDEVVNACVSGLRQARNDGWGIVEKTVVEVKRTRATFTNRGIEADYELNYNEEIDNTFETMPDILTILQSRTDLTRSTIFKIISESKRVSDFLLNPQKALDIFTKVIARAMEELLVKGIQYTKVNEAYDMELFKVEIDHDTYKNTNDLYEVQNRNKTPFDTVECDSNVEKEIAKYLDKHEQVKFFMKLPSWFKIETPVGTYNPDWAYVVDGDERLYLVKESKSTTDTSLLRLNEKLKIDCGKAHFNSLGENVEMGLVNKTNELLKV